MDKLTGRDESNYCNRNWKQGGGYSPLTTHTASIFYGYGCSKRPLIQPYNTGTISYYHIKP